MKPQPFALIAMVLLAGCAGGESRSSDAGMSDLEGLQDDSAGLVQGIVTTEELAPIAGARVTLLEASRTTNTTDEGAFAFPGVAPGSYQLFVEALGYQSIARRLDVVSGVNEPLRVTLDLLPVITTYTEVLIRRGYSLCDINAVYLSFTLALPGCEAKATVFDIEVNETWRYGIVEQTWQASESMNLVSDNEDYNCLLDNSDPCFIWLVGQSPLRFDARPNDQNFSRAPDYLYPDKAFKWAILGYSAGMFQEEIANSGTCLRSGEPTCNGVGVSLGTYFDLYVSIFHHEEPTDPTAYSAMPDA